MNNLYIVSEEQHSITTLNNIKLFLDLNNIDYSSDNLSMSSFRIHSHKTICMKIEGIFSQQVENFYWLLARKNGNGFADCLIYLSEDFPKEDDKPNHVFENTKNDGKDSGNMVEQRAEKAIPVFEKWGSDVPYTFLISNRNDTTQTIKSFKQTHNCSFATIKALGDNVTIAITKDNEIGYELYNSTFKYDSIQSIEKNENLKKKRRGVPSRVNLVSDKVFISVNLWKKSGENDPGLGYMTSRAYLVRRLNPQVEIVIRNHQRPKSYFDQTKDNKWVNILKTVGVTIKFEDGEEIKFDQSKHEYKTYWKYCNTGEKISSIYLEQILREKGWDIIFTNHAGCGKSFVEINGQSFNSEKTKGIPDLVAFNGTNLIVIEAEKSKNAKKGLIQMDDPHFDKFIEKNILTHLPQGVTYKKFLCTYGKKTEEKELLFNVNENLETYFNEEIITNL